jgi:hypothetical protein
LGGGLLTLYLVNSWLSLWHFARRRLSRDRLRHFAP